MVKLLNDVVTRCMGLVVLVTPFVWLFELDLISPIVFELLLRILFALLIFLALVGGVILIISWLNFVFNLITGRLS